MFPIFKTPCDFWTLCPEVDSSVFSCGLLDIVSRSVMLR